MARRVMPKGFKVNGIHCGIKRFSKDLGLIFSRFPCKAAGVFTKNKMKAAPITVTKDVVNRGGPIHAIIVNSGNANCCTGRYGTKDAKRIVHAVCDSLKLNFGNVCIASTGIIGKRLPVDDIVTGVPKLVKRLSEKAIPNFAKAILTTDRMTKVETVTFNVGKKEVVITGICKGAGMIYPNMATMLCFVTTDAKIDKDALKNALKRSVVGSFNRITIDGDMSTNDCVLLLANGQAQNRTIKKDTKEYEAFVKALQKVTLELAKDIVRDGEGATKFVTIYVKGAKTEKDAEIVARAIANSSLVKTSIFGQDGNWGRVASTIGASMADGIKQKKLEIWLDGVCMFKHGEFTNPSSVRAARVYKRKNIKIMINLNAGNKSATIFTCDLSKKYVAINAHYLT